MPEGNFTNNLIVGTPAPLPPRWADDLVHASIEDSTNVPAVATVRYRDKDARLLQDNGIVIGGRLTVAVRSGDKPAPVRLFTGDVVTVETEFDGSGTFTVVRALDQSHRLMRGRRVESYVNQKASDIARVVARRAKLSIGTIDRTKIVYDMVTQPNVTDWEFLKMLAVDNDSEVAVVDGRFHFRAPVRAASAPGAGATAKQRDEVAEMGKNVLSIRSTVTSVGQVPAVRVRGWNARFRQPLTSRVPVATADEVLLTVTPGQVAAPFGAAELLVADVPYETAAEVQSVATALAAQVAAGFAELEVALRGNPKLRAGVPFALSGAGKPFDGKYTITSSRHVFAPHLPYETWLTVSGGQDRSLTGLSTGANAPARSARVPGLAIGVVTDTKAGLGRRHPERRDQPWVKLTFPWLSDTYETDWVRTVQFGGVGGGGVICPEVGDEVLVGFEQGLLDRPVVLGGLYNGVDKPSPHSTPLIDPTSGEVNRIVLASRTDRARDGRTTGNWVELLDSALAPQGVRLRTQKGTDNLVVHLDRANTSVVVKSDGTVEITGTTGVAIESQGQISVDGNGISLNAGAGALNLRGARVSINGTGAVAVTGTPITLN
ncbi:VgrG-related protein [Actinomycetes bacterium KLBMP 9797]